MQCSSVWPSLRALKYSCAESCCLVVIGTCVTEPEWLRQGDSLGKRQGNDFLLSWFDYGCGIFFGLIAAISGEKGGFFCAVLFLSRILPLWAHRLREEQNAVVIGEGGWGMDLAVFGVILMCVPFDAEKFSEKEEILLDVTSRLWFTYRKNFPAIGMYCGRV